MAATIRVLILPGWQNAGPTHWQSRWQALHGVERVQQADWDWPRRGDWKAQLEEAVWADSCPTALVAPGLGCQLVAAWAAHTRHAGDWGAEALSLGARGRIDGDSGLGDWPAGLRCLRRFPAAER